MPATTAVARGQVDFTGTDVFRVDNGLLALRHGRTTRHDDVTGTGGLKQATLKACCSVPRFRLQTAVRSHARRLGTLFGIVRILSVTYRATAVVSGAFSNTSGRLRTLSPGRPLLFVRGWNGWA